MRRPAARGQRGAVGARFDVLARGEAPEGDLDLVTLCHNEHYVTELRHIAPTSGMVYVDGDTSMSPAPGKRCMRGVGGAVRDRCRDVGQASQCLCRGAPARHHAEINKPMGFLLSSTMSRSPARHAQRKYGIGRAAIVDFDVHHGNGTQGYFLGRQERDVLLDPPDAAVSRHRRARRTRRPRHYRQCAAGLRDGSRQFRAAFENVILPQLTKFALRADRDLGRLRRHTATARFLNLRAEDSAG